MTQKLDQDAARKKAIAMRAELPSEQADAHAKAMCEHLKNTDLFLHSDFKVGVYFAVNHEISLTSVIEHCWQMNIDCFLPVISQNDDKQPLQFYPYTANTELRKNQYKIPEPGSAHDNVNAVAAKDLDVIFLPVVAYDLSGHRVGTGKGYYDRTLADREAKKPILVGCAYELQQMHLITPNPWDIPLDMVVTEHRIVTF